MLFTFLVEGMTYVFAESRLRFVVVFWQPVIYTFVQHQ